MSGVVVESPVPRPQRHRHTPIDPDQVTGILHDIVGHHLVLLTGQIRIWRSEGRECNADDLTLLAEMSESAQRDLRRVSTLLRTGDTEKPSPFGLMHWIDELTSRVPHVLADISTTVSTSGDLDITPTQEILIERVVREGVSNAAKHGPGGRVMIGFEFGSEVVVTVRSLAGRSATARAERQDGSGLHGLVAAVTRSHGRLTTHHSSAGWFILEVSLPR